MLRQTIGLTSLDMQLVGVKSKVPKKYKKLEIEREPNGKFCVIVDNKVVASGLKLKEVSEKVEEYLNA